MKYTRNNDVFGSSSFGNSANNTSNNWGSGFDDFQQSNSNRFGDLDEGYTIGISLSDSDDEDSDDDGDEKKSQDDLIVNGDTKSDSIVGEGDCYLLNLYFSLLHKFYIHVILKRVKS